MIQTGFLYHLILFQPGTGLKKSADIDHDPPG